MKLWMMVMRGLEPIMEGYERLFDAWEEGGVDGIVLGPMLFDAAPLGYRARPLPSERPATPTFDPDPEIYRRFGVEQPPAPGEVLPEKRKRLEEMLTAAKDRGWSVWIFTPGSGMGPGGGGPFITDGKSRAAFAARTVDTMEHYPMADGGIMDGPEWAYEICPGHRSYLFDSLPETFAPACRELGYDYAALVAAKDRLFERLHHLDARRVALDAPGGLLGAFQLLGGDPDLLAWIRFRIESLAGFFASVRAAVDAHASRRICLGVGPRSACFAPLAGYDFARLAKHMDVLLPKHYFWHRGFDGMYGTVGRYVDTLTAWNPGLGDADALAVVKAFLGLELPGVTCRSDLDSGFPPEFFESVVKSETRRALAAVDDPDRIVPWVDTGRCPHDGDPMTAGDLRRILDAAEDAGLRRFLCHHHGNLTDALWSVLSAKCGTPWHPSASDYRPPDLPVL